MKKIKYLWPLLTFTIITIVVGLFFYQRPQLKSQNKKYPELLNGVNYLVYRNQEDSLSYLFVKLILNVDTIEVISFDGKFNSISEFNYFDTSDIEYYISEKLKNDNRLEKEIYLKKGSKILNLSSGELFFDSTAADNFENKGTSEIYFLSKDVDNGIYLIVHDNSHRFDDVYKYIYVNKFWVISYIYGLEHSSEIKYDIVQFNGNNVDFRGPINRSLAR